MALGLSPAFAASLLNVLNNMAPALPPALYLAQHTGDPGVAGTANPSALATRSLIDFTTSAAGEPLALSGSPSFTMTATETIACFSAWSAVTGGTYEFSGAWDVSQQVNAGDIIVVDSLSFGIAPVAA